jgi:hypothetical protein
MTSVVGVSADILSGCGRLPLPPVALPDFTLSPPIVLVITLRNINSPNQQSFHRGVVLFAAAQHSAVNTNSTLPSRLFQVEKSHRIGEEKGVIKYLRR